MDKSLFYEIVLDQECEIESLYDLKHFEPGERLPLSDTTGGGFYCIKSGHIKLDLSYGGKINPIGICGPGDTVGYETWFTNDLMSAVALDKVAACYFPQREFRELQSANPILCQSVTKMLCEKISEYQAGIVSLENYSVKAKVSGLLCHLNRKFGVAEKSGSKIDIKIDRKTMAQMSGTVAESFARALTDLEQDQIIERKGRAIFILDQKRLEASRV